MKKAIKDYLAKLQDNKKDKGFSLVELIIVIAIMAILVGVVASQVLPYIEKSRKAKDLEALNNVSSDMVTAMTDAMASGATIDDFDITVTAAAGGGSATCDKTPKAPGTSGAKIEEIALYKYEETKGNATPTTATSLIKVLSQMKSDDAKTQFKISYDKSTKELTVQGGKKSDTALKAVSSLN